MIGEFKAFLLKHGVIALAVAVVIGGAVQKLVAAIVADLIMPIIGALTPGGNWRTATLSIGVVKLSEIFSGRCWTFSSSPSWCS